MLPIKKRKSIGQHILKNKEIIRDLCNFITENAPENKYVLFEIGSGQGNLTIPLLKKLYTLPNKPELIILNEIDYRYLKLLKNNLQEEKLDELFRIEFLTQPFEKCSLNHENVYLVGNIPFYITGLVFRKLVQSYSLINRVVINLQKDVVDKISSPNNPLGITFHIGWEVVKYRIIPPELYDPPPKVFSQIVLMKNKKNSLISEKFVKFLYKIFTARKKLLKNILNEKEKATIRNPSVLDKRPIHLNPQEVIDIYKDIYQCT